MDSTIATVINKLDAYTMNDTKQTQPVSKFKNLAFSNCTAGSALAAKADVGSRVYTVSNVSERLAKECMNEKGRFTVCQMKHCTAKEQHYKLLMCFGAGQSSKVEVFAVDSKNGLLDSTMDFPDLTKGYTFETPHSAILSAPTIFTSPTALRNSALNLVELFRLDNLRTQNKHPAGGHEE